MKFLEWFDIKEHRVKPITWRNGEKVWLTKDGSFRIGAWWGSSEGVKSMPVFTVDQHRYLFRPMLVIGNFAVCIPYIRLVKKNASRTS